MLDPNVKRLLIMLAFPVILAIVPIRLQKEQLLKLAFSIWMAGGLVLSWRGIQFLADTTLPMTTLILAVFGALLIGMLKGKFVLNKSSIRNIIRLQALEMPQRPIHVYPLRSWIVISIMLMISLSLNFFNVDTFIRGLVNLGVGMGLMTSSFIYLRYRSVLPDSGSDPSPETFEETVASDAS
jgi:hypothetical protein